MATRSVLYESGKVVKVFRIHITTQKIQPLFTLRTGGMWAPTAACTDGSLAEPVRLGKQRDLCS